MHAYDERAGAVEGAGEHLVADRLARRQRLPCDGGLVHLADAVDDDRVGADAHTRADPHMVTEAQLDRVHHCLAAVGVHPRRLLGLWIRVGAAVAVLAAGGAALYAWQRRRRA
ncbi:hypothetical protein BFV98_30395 [Micromonospora sp. WMMB235]|nr:hypothetical protein BFV98_30395 [Micromonospora sp. WMMB235]